MAMRFSFGRVFARDALGFRYSSADIRCHLEGAVRWLCRAQDKGGGGIARSYSLRWNRAHNKRGWLAAYPETTGYIIPTFFEYAVFTAEKEYAERAVRMAEWEAE